MSGDDADDGTELVSIVAAVGLLAAAAWTGTQGFTVLPVTLGAAGVMAAFQGLR